MIEKCERIQTVRARAICECGGEFKYNNDNVITDLFGSFFKTTECKFLHKCDKCGKEESFDIMYPKTIELTVPVQLVKDATGAIYTVDEHQTDKFN
jgi:hypothetical protein